MNKEQVDALVEASLQVLDDMGKDGKCCCGYAKAKLRIVIEPFLPPDDYSDLMDPAEAARICKECDQ